MGSLKEPLFELKKETRVVRRKSFDLFRDRLPRNLQWQKKLKSTQVQEARSQVRKGIFVTAAMPAVGAKDHHSSAPPQQKPRRHRSSLLPQQKAPTAPFACAAPERSPRHKRRGPKAPVARQ